MHESSFNEMRSVLYRYLHVYSTNALKVVDVGACSIAGQPTYRDLMAEKWNYIGVDVVEGPNVDMVMSPYKLPFPDRSINVVISGQTLEHVERPWMLVTEMARVLDPGGHIFLVCPAYQHLHKFPKDCWRIYPDGMRVLLEDAGFNVRETYTWPHDGLLSENYGRPQIVDCWGIGIKK